VSTVRYAVLSCTVRYGTECLNIRTILFSNGPCKNGVICLYYRKKIVTLFKCGTVQLVRRTEEEKYGTVRYGHLSSTATP